TGRGGEHDLVFVQIDSLDVGVGERANEADLNFVGKEHIHYLLRAARTDYDVDAWVLAAEGVQDARQDVGRNGRRGAEPEGAGLHVLNVAHRVAAFLECWRSRSTSGRKALPGAVSRTPRLPRRNHSSPASPSR